jgi:P27 family predicted phage terminase small subunit
MPEKVENIACPEWFQEDKVAFGIWHWATDILSKKKVLTEADLPTVEMFCLTYTALRHLWRDLEKEGRVVYMQKMDSLGNEIMEAKANPKATQFNNLLTQYRQFSSMLGFDPSSRPRLKMEGGGDDDPLKDF